MAEIPDWVYDNTLDPEAVDDIYYETIKTNLDALFDTWKIRYDWIREIFVFEGRAAILFITVILDEDIDFYLREYEELKAQIGYFKLSLEDFEGKIFRRRKIA